MRKSRFLSRVLVTSLITALCATAAEAAAQPNGVCTPPGEWISGAAVNTTVVRAWGAFFPADGRFYVAGGRFDDTAGDDLLNIRIYDPATNTWSTSAASFADGQVNNMVGGVVDFGGTPSIVLVGGSAAGGTTSTSDVRQYDPATDTLTVLGNDSWIGNTDGTMLPGGAAVVDNKLYVFGGFHINVGMLDTIYQFDPSAAEGSRWSTMTATLPTPIGYIPTTPSNGLIYLAGGSLWDDTVDPPTILDSQESSVYDPVADTITAIAQIPRVTGETRAVTEPDGTVWVLGGGRGDMTLSNLVDIYDPATDSWTKGPPFSFPRRNLAADVDPVSGDIFTAGGYDTDGTTSLDVTEVFDACTDTGPPDDIFVDGFDGPPTG